MIEYAWHYTTGECFIKIAESGVLELATAFLPEGEKPILWFSINQKWEPTSGKGLIKNGERRALKTMQENFEHGRGLARFGFPPAGLIPWIKLPIRPATKRGLEKAGRGCGANPFQWMGTESPPILWTVRKAATKTAGGQSWYREERRTHANSKLKRLNWLPMAAVMFLK